MAGNRDLEFALKFKNQAKAVIAQVRQDLRGLGVDLKNVSTQMQSIGANGNKLSSAMGSVSAGAQRAQLAQDRLTNAQKALEIQNVRLMQSEAALMLREQQLAQTSDRLLLSQQRLEQQQKKLSQGSSFLGGAFGGIIRQLIPLTAGFAAIKSIQLVDEFNQLEGRVKNATKGIDEARVAFKGLNDIARKTGSGLEAPVAIFQRLSFVREEIKATIPEMLQFTDTVAKLGVVSGASPDALKNGLTQLGQSLSGNIVRAEEFNSIMENIPAVGTAIAKEMGVTSGQLRQLVINGKVLSEDVFTAILKATEKANEQFAALPESTTRAFQGFLLDLQESLGLLDKMGNATSVLVGAFHLLGNSVKAIAGLMGALFKIFSFAGEALYLGIQEGFAKSKEAFADFVSTVSGGKIKIKATITAPDGTELTSKDIEEMFQSAQKDARAAVGESVKSGADAVADIYGTASKKAETATKTTREFTKSYKELADQLAATQKKTKQETFYAGLADKIALLKEETLWVGKNKDEKERALTVEKLQQEAVKAGIKNFNPQEFLKAYDALHEAEKKVHTDFKTGLEVAMREFAENARNMGDLAAEVFGKAVGGIDNITRGLVDGSIKNFRDLRGAVGKSLADIAGDIASFVVKQMAVNAILGFFGGGSSGPISWNAAGTTSQFGGVQKFAKGGVTNGPEIFQTNKGPAMRGEAGPEGILPLKRLSNGDLGVQAQGSGGGSGTVINYMPTFNVGTGSGNNQANGGGNGDFMKILDSEVRKTVMEVISDQQRPGGTLGGGRGKTA